MAEERNMNPIWNWRGEKLFPDAPTLKRKFLFLQITAIICLGFLFYQILGTRGLVNFSILSVAAFSTQIFFPHEFERFQDVARRFGKFVGQIITETCARMGVPCIDLLPPFQESGYKLLFLQNQSGHMDVWHLSPQGHQLTAGIVGDFFKKGIPSPSGLPLQ